MPSEAYTGYRNARGDAVVRRLRNGHLYTLRPRDDLANHSPTGFEWGYGGSGPAQLALAILADALGDPERALRLHQRFKFKVIGALDQHKPWRLSLGEVLIAVAKIERSKAA